MTDRRHITRTGLAEGRTPPPVVEEVAREVTESEKEKPWTRRI